MHTPLPSIHGFSHEDIVAACDDLGQPRYRADQLWRWMYVSRAASWEAMRNLPSEFRKQLDERFNLQSVTPCEITGNPGKTRKVLATLQDGEQVEAAIIPAPRRNTVCVSSQVGCRFNCSFCASGKAGLERNLTTGEIVGQVLLAADVLGTLPSHVVFMGVGEPFDNYDAVLSAIRIINNPEGIGIGARRITISTCGVVPGIQRLAKEGLQVELSVSLHGPSSELRRTLMPIENTYPLPMLLEACRAYSSTTNRIVTFEYTLIGGVNDSLEDARMLARLLEPLPCRVNLIPLSRIEEYQGHAAPSAAADLFIETLRTHRINATLRDSKGAPLDAACGQLRIKHIRLT